MLPVESRSPTGVTSAASAPLIKLSHYEGVFHFIFVLYITALSLPPNGLMLSTVPNGTDLICHCLQAWEAYEPTGEYAYLTRRPP
jgi:hypothetical protein